MILVIPYFISSTILDFITLVLFRKVSHIPHNNFALIKHTFIMRFTNDGYFTSSIITCPDTAIYDYSIIWRANGKIILSTYTKYGSCIKRIITTPILRDYTNYPTLKYDSFLTTYFAKIVVNPPHFRGNVLYSLYEEQGILDSINRKARKI